MYTVYGIYRGEQKELDTVDTEEEARYLVNEYSLAFGSDWVIYFEYTFKIHVEDPP